MTETDVALGTEGSAAYHLVAPVELVERELVADLDESKVCTRIAAGVDRMKAGLRPGNLYAVWDFPHERPNPREAADVARLDRPARVLVHVGAGELLQLSDSYRVHLLIKEG